MTRLTARPVLLLCALLAAGCGTKDDDPKAKPDPGQPGPGATDPSAPDPGSTPPTRTAVDHYLDYVSAFNERDEKRLAAAFAPGAVLTLADTPEPMTGADAIVKGNVEFWTAMPDTRLEPQVVIADGNRVAALLLGHGTHTGPMQTPAGTLQPTESATGAYGIELVDLDDRGKITRGTQFWDVGLLFAQIQKTPGARPALRKGAGKPVILTAEAGGRTAHVKTIEAMFAAYAADPKARASLMADDGVVWSSGVAEDMVGPKAVADYALSRRKGFPDARTEVLSAVGAGDYVFATVKYSGTNTRPLPPLLPKPTGTSFSVTAGHVFELGADGKIAREWAVVNSLAVMTQLGITPPAPK